VLTGSSGTGKSSLLQAFVIPEMREGTPPCTVLLLRSYEDRLPNSPPSREPGVIWTKPPADLNTLKWDQLLPVQSNNSASRVPMPAWSSFSISSRNLSFLTPPTPARRASRHARVSPGSSAGKRDPMAFTLLLPCAPLQDLPGIPRRAAASASVNWQDVPPSARATLPSSQCAGHRF